MPPNDEKRRQREEKRAIKRAGNKSRRQKLKRDLIVNPEEAAHSEADVGRHTSAPLNGIDHDATRQRETAPEPEDYAPDK